MRFFNFMMWLVEQKIVTVDTITDLNQDMEALNVKYELLFI